MNRVRKTVVNKRSDSLVSHLYLLTYNLFVAHIVSVAGRKALKAHIIEKVFTQKHD